MRIAIRTLGCKSNRYESDKVFEALRDKYEVYEANEGASTFFDKAKEKPSDVLVVNTCTVTHVADRKSRQAIRSYKRKNPDCRVVVFGCASNVAKEEYEAMKEVNFRADTANDVVDFVKKVAAELEELESCAYEGNKLDADRGMRTRALLKIQDGCNSFCSYCIIPFTRGPEISFKSKDILAEAQQKETEGYREIVLTGINIGEWKEDGMDLADLFEVLINGTDNIRYRVSSIEPKNFSPKFFELFKTGRFCPHVHMSLQSGCDTVLKRMRRHYDTALFEEVCNNFRAAVPDIGLTTDIIVGFPGETEKEFMETHDFAERLNFSKIHVFPYSKRKNTAAWQMKDHVSDDDKKDRSRRLRELSDRMELQFRKDAVGGEYELLVEDAGDDFLRGLTDNYVSVILTRGTGSLKVGKGDLLKVKLVKLLESGMVEGVAV